MSDENIFEELEETHRKLWAESDGTLDGYFRHCSEVGRSARERFLAEQAGMKSGRCTPPRRRKADFADATAVHEDMPKYGTGERSDSDRDAGGEGEE